MSSAPAFWSAVTHWRPGGPASHHRRGRAWEAGRAATTPMVRRRPASLPGKQTASGLPREPGAAFVQRADAQPGGRTGTMAYPAPRWGGVFRLARSASGADPDQGGRALWGRASSLSVRAVEGGRAFPRECRSGLVLSPTRPWRCKGRCDVCSAGVPPAMLVYRCGLVLSPTDTDTDADTAPVPVAVVVPDRVLIAGLLGRRDALASRRPSVAPSAWSRVGGGEGCDHADGAPTAFLVAGTADRIALPEGAR